MVVVRIKWFCNVILEIFKDLKCSTLLYSSFKPLTLNEIYEDVCIVFKPENKRRKILVCFKLKTSLKLNKNIYQLM